MLKTFILGSVFISGFAYAQQPATPQTVKPLKFDVGYFSEGTRARIETQFPVIEAEFKKLGIEANISATRAGVRQPNTPVPWDIAITNPTLVAMQRQNKLALNILFWAKDCHYETMALAKKGAPNDINFYKGKKILVYGTNYVTYSNLKSVIEWGLDKSVLYYDYDPVASLKALVDGKVDLVLTDSTVNPTNKANMPVILGRASRDLFTEVAITSHKYPCRALSHKPNLSAAQLTAVKKIVETSQSELLKRFDLVDQAEFAKMEKELKDPKIQNVKKSLKKLAVK